MTPTLYKQIPGYTFDFADIYDLAVSTAPLGSALVECGSLWGQSTAYLAEAAKIANKDLRVYCVDMWDEREDSGCWMFDPVREAEQHIEPVIHAQHGNNCFRAFAFFIERTKLSPDPLRILRMSTFEAAPLLAPLKPWLVFLDDNHDYEHVIREIPSWIPCVADGGIIAGHDYGGDFPQVKRAVDESFANRRMTVETSGRSWMVRL
jgi:cephalosporin hydroxylase